MLECDSMDLALEWVEIHIVRPLFKGGQGTQLQICVWELDDRKGLDLPPPITGTPYTDNTKTISAVLCRYVEAEQLAAATRLRNMCNPDAAPTDILDVTVTFDGTWSKHGLTALYGVCVVISWVTGEVLDTELLSRYCVQCSKYKGDTEGEEYERWYAAHEAKCTLTHTGSSPAMEVATPTSSAPPTFFKVKYSAH